MKDRENTKNRRNTNLKINAREWLKELQAQNKLAPFRRNECENCNGLQCMKITDKYQKDGEKCRVWLEVVSKEKITEAGIPGKYVGKTFADYDETPENRTALRLARRFLNKPTGGLYIYGGVGTGKTFLASLIGQEYVRNFKRVVFENAPVMLSKLKGTFDKPCTSLEEVFVRYSKAPLLILDDFGCGYMTDWAVDMLYQLVNVRYDAELPLIATSNYDLTGLKEKLSRKDEHGGARIASRLSEMCYLAFLGTEDRRKKS